MWTKILQRILWDVETAAISSPGSTGPQGRFHSRLVTLLTTSLTNLVRGITYTSIRFHSRCFGGIGNPQPGVDQKLWFGNVGMPEQREM